MTAPPRILAIAGSDSSGGAGIQADIKTITMLGGYAMTAITAVTAQNTTGVAAVEVLSADLVIAQLDACLSDIGADAVKIGMLGSAEIADRVYWRLSRESMPVIFDPVMVATSGSLLADDATIRAFDFLMQRASVITPNLPELQVLSRMPVETSEQVHQAALDLAERTGAQVLAKGGHAGDREVVDLLVAPEGYAHRYAHERIDTPHTHGTGCTLSSAIATLLAEGQEIERAVRGAQSFVRAALLAAPGFGAGHGPMGHQAVRQPSHSS